MRSLRIAGSRIGLVLIAVAVVWAVLQTTYDLTFADQSQSQPSATAWREVSGVESRITPVGQRDTLLVEAHGDGIDSWTVEYRYGYGDWTLAGIETTAPHGVTTLPYAQYRVMVFTGGVEDVAAYELTFVAYAGRSYRAWVDGQGD